MASTVQFAGAKDSTVRGFAIGLVGAAAIWPLLPVHPPLACPLRSTTGVPCPFCGMTRASVALVKGHIVDAFNYNPGVFLIFALAVVVLVMPSLLRRVRAPVWALTAGMAALWVWNVGFNPTFGQWFT
jgi:hypothetical protein